MHASRSHAALVGAAVAALALCHGAATADPRSVRATAPPPAARLSARGPLAGRRGPPVAGQPCLAPHPPWRHPPARAAVSVRFLRADRHPTAYRQRLATVPLPPKSAAAIVDVPCPGCGAVYFAAVAPSFDARALLRAELRALAHLRLNQWPQFGNTASRI